ncbi:MAG: HD domain-containing protein [Candidatus Magnetominusculus sp. LBB02]|nr:HD domain-containing protein [Candidatus Magnetominusculus sp. LBB02]
MILEIPYIDILAACLSDGRQTYAVGGAVRDLILGRRVRDYDLAISESPFPAAQCFARAISGSYVALHEIFPTARVVKGDLIFDFTSLRGGTIASDLLSRDFTANALAVSTASPSSVIDLTGGVDDIRNKIIRMVSKDNLADDPVRLLRAFRAAAELGFTIEGATLEAIAELRPLISGSAAERIWAELKMLLQCGNSTEIVRAAFETGLLFELLPELEPLLGLSQNQYHHLDAFEHTMAAYKAAEAIISNPAVRICDSLSVWLDNNPHKRAMIKLSILLHDVGKFSTQGQSEDGRVTFHGHERQGETMVSAILDRFRASAKEARLVTMLVRNHMRILAFKQAGGSVLAMMRRPLIRLLNAVGGDIYALAVLWAADAAAKPQGNAKTIAICREILDFYECQFLPRKTAPRFITGRDLIQTYGLSPSPLFSEILNAIELKTLEGQIDSKDKAAVVVEQFLHRGHDG